jgi:cellulose synthase/poly-beta-1,6-N-acetylglucosamine synthase-like glycosyltransferase
VPPAASSAAFAPALVPTEPAWAPAPSQPIARAARAFGDAYPAVRQWPIRVAGVLLIASIVFYAPWLWRSMNRSLPWLSWPYVLANAFTLANWLLSIFNAWSRWVPEPRRVAAGAEPVVGVIIPTCGEPVPMVLRTIISVLEQDWPRDRLVVVVSDDGHDPELEAAVEYYGVVYHSPPPRFAPGRDGAAKSGNLNSALALLDEIVPGVAYVETRDADDELPSLGFLRHAVGQLEADGGLAYVQTIKEAQVSPGDPFNNRDTTFYRSQLLARNAANAVFPCGSGLVWRRTALHDIGEFPTWNLVEDLQSGVEALRRGWRGLYVPIVGAVPQHSPEDVPNFYKQRGSWALDTVRLIVWRGLRGLNLRQRAQFLELFCFYLSGFTVLAYVPAIICALLGWMPLQTSAWGFAVHMLPIALAIELWLLTLTAPYNDRRKRQRRVYRDLWRVRTMWAGLAPVFMKASIQAVLNGPKRKPTYKVTRKFDDKRWHWRHTLPQTTIVASVAVVLVYALRFGGFPNVVLFLGCVYWGGLNIILLSNFITRGWYGLFRARGLVRIASARGSQSGAPQTDST